MHKKNYNTFLHYSWIMLKFAMKYLSLILLVALILFLTKQYVDYSGTVYFIFIIPFLLILFLINLIVLYSVDFIKYRKKQGNFKNSNFVVLILIIISVIHFSLNYYMENKSVYLSSNLDESRVTLTLYKNKTFKITNHWNHGTDNLLGNYELKNNELSLKKNDLEKMSNFAFTYNYIIFFDDKIIKPNKIGFKNLTFE